MAIRAFINTFIMPDLQTGAGGIYPYSRRSWNTLGTNAGQRIINYNNGGAINMYALTAQAGGGIYTGMTASDITDGVSVNSTIGFTYTPPSNSNLIDSYGVLTIGAAVWPQLELSPSVTTVQIAIIIDRTVTPNMATLLRNGVYVSKKSLGNGLYAGGAVIYFSSGAGRAGMSSTFSHLYFIDDTQDDTQCSFITDALTRGDWLTNGAFTSDWVGSSGGANLIGVSISAMNTVAAITTPTYNSPATPSKLKMSLNAYPNSAYGKVYGFETAMMAVRTDATTVGKMTFELDAFVENKPNLPFISTSTMNYDMRSGISTKAPDGGAWTADKFSRLVITLTPST